MARSSDSRKLLEWQRRMARFAKSSRSVAEFCQQEEVSVPAFYQWRKKLQRLRQGTSSGAGTSGFTAVRLVAAAGVAVHLPGGMRFDVPVADPQALQLVIETLARVDAEHAGGESC